MSRVIAKATATRPAATIIPFHQPSAFTSKVTTISLQDLRAVKSALDELLDVFKPMGRLASLSEAALVVLEEAMARVQQIASMPFDHSVAEILYNPVLLVEFLRRIPGSKQMTSSWPGQISSNGEVVLWFLLSRVGTISPPDEVTSGLIADLVAGQQKVLDKYGGYLTTNNGRNPLIDLYQKLCDAAMYSEQATQEGRLSSHDLTTQELLRLLYHAKRLILDLE